MLGVERLDGIMEMLKDGQAVSIHTLSKTLYISESTLRRDLAALQKEGAECRVIMPLYGSIGLQWRANMTFLTSFGVPLSWRVAHCGVFTMQYGGVQYYFLDNEQYFKREGGIYGYFDEAERFAFFSKAVLETLTHIDYEPDVIHCNDWQTALIPVYLNVFYREVPKLSRTHTVFTIHNIQYQGQFGLDVAGDVCGLPDWAIGKVEFHGDLNMMKGALEECERISTVSPTYAKEILDPYFGHGLDEILRQKQWKLCGILNGIDTVGYNPSRDHALAANFSARKPEGKALCKAALQQQMHLPEERDTPILAMVSRLVSHKGFDLVEYAMENMLRMGMQVVILGSGEYRYEEFFREMQRRHPQQVAFTCGFMPTLSRQIYAGADFFLMPSQSEPCGLAQMIALRYGTIPIVRSTGGLADSIIDWDTPGGGCGFTFQSYNADDMLGAVRRAMGLYHSEYRYEMLPRALKCDFSWRRSAKQYMAMYLGI